MSFPSRGAVLLFAVALAARLALLFAGPWTAPQRGEFGDSPRYLALAANLKQLGTFGLADEEKSRAWAGLKEIREANGTQPPRDAHGLYPEVMRTPGYPLAVAAAWAVSGDVRAILVVQCVLGALAALCVARIGRELGLSPKAAFAAGLLWAIHPGLIVRDVEFLTESLFTSLGVFGTYFAVCGPRGWKGWLLSGLCLGYTGLIRPLGTLFLPAAAFYAARRADRPRWLAAVVVLAVGVLPTVGWAARNAATGNGFRLTTIGDMTLLYHFAGYTISEERGKDWLDEWPRTTEELLAKVRARVQPGDDVYKAVRAQAVEELAARPWATARVLLKSWVKLVAAHSVGEAYQLVGAEYRPTNLLNRYVLREEGGQQQPVSIGEVILPLAWSGANVLIAGLAVVGAVRAVRRRHLAFALPLVLTIALFTAATFSQGMERFRSPFQYALFLLAVAPWGLRRTDEPSVPG